MVHLADSHIHLFRNGFAGRYHRSPAGHGDEVGVYEAYRRAHDIGTALVVGYEGDNIDASNNEYIRMLAQARPWLVTLGHVSAFDRPTAAGIDRLLGAGHRGMSLYLTSTEAADAALGWSSDTWRPLRERRAIVSVNVDRHALPAVEALARKHEACSFAISHLGDPGRYRTTPGAATATERLATLLSMARLPNVYVKISGLYAVSDPPYAYPHVQADPFVELILGAFGPARCLWGSDFSPSLDFVSFEQAANPLQLAGLSTAEYAQVMGGSLETLLADSGT